MNWLNNKKYKTMGKPRETSMTYGVDLTKALSHGITGIRKKMRDISRTLNRGNLSADIKIANERALDTLKIELEKVQEEQKEKKYALKYHKVKFFERKKAVKRYNRSKKEVEELEKKINEDKEHEAELKKNLKKAKRVYMHSQIDLAYVFNFPRNMKYISLYSITDPNSKELPERARKGVKETNAKREELRKRFAEELKQGKLEVSLEQALKDPSSRNKKHQERRSNQRQEVQIDSRNGKKEAHEEEEEDDFFE